MTKVTADEEVTLPDDYTELFIIVTPTVSDQFIFNIPKIALDTTLQVFSNGMGIYASAWYLYHIQIAVSTTKVVLKKSRYSNNTNINDCMSTSKMKVYYR